MQYEADWYESAVHNRQAVDSTTTRLHMPKQSHASPASTEIARPKWPRTSINMLQ